MPITLDQLKQLPSMFDELIGKPFPEVVHFVIFESYRRLTGKEVTVFPPESPGQRLDDPPQSKTA